MSNNHSSTDPKAKLILAVDTSSSEASFAVARGDRIVASFASQVQAPHSKTFFSHISNLLGIAGLEIGEMDLLAAATGPGSFTGLRVGLAAIKGLAQTLGKPSFGVTTIDALALDAGVCGLVLVMIEAGRDEVYCGLREISTSGTLNPVGSDQVGPAQLLINGFIERFRDTPPVVVGRGALKYRQSLEEVADLTGSRLRLATRPAAGSQFWQLKTVTFPTAAMIAQHANHLYQSGIESGIEAYYVRPSDAEIKWSN